MMRSRSRSTSQDTHLDRRRTRMSSIPRVPNRASRILLLAGVIVMAAAVSQCKMVTDSATRPQVDPTGAGNCISACAHEANDRMREESDLHVANVKACKSPECKQ